MVLVFTVLLFLSMLLLGMELLLSDKKLLLDSQPSSIESGFEKLWHSSFISSPFFMLAVIFVLFDLELVILLPCLLTANSTSVLVLLSLLMVVVFFTLLVEWAISGLKWHI